MEIKFERCKGFGEEITLPTRATEGSAGYDIRAAETAIIYPGDTAVIKTGVKARFDKDKVLLIAVRSSIGIKRRLMLANNIGVIDSDYYNNEETDGQIFIALHNYGQEVQTIVNGERIAQGIFIPFFKTSDDSADGKRKGGIGSTNG